MRSSQVKREERNGPVGKYEIDTSYRSLFKDVYLIFALVLLVQVQAVDEGQEAGAEALEEEGEKVAFE